MGVGADQVKPGKCFSTSNGQVRRVELVSQDGKTVTYVSRGKKAVKGSWGSRVRVRIEKFAHDVDKEVPEHFDPNYPG